MEDEVKLLGFWSSGFAARVKLALKAKGIPFEYVEQDIFNKNQLLLDSNPTYKTVPVLIHNAKLICESRLIIEYIDEAWPATPRLLPENPYDRYLVRFWSDFIDKKQWEIWNLIMSVNTKSTEERSPVYNKAREENHEMLMRIENGVAEMERRGLLNDAKSLQYMDMCLCAWLRVIEPLTKLLGFEEVDPEKFPFFHGWVQNLLANNAVNSTLPDSAEFTEYAKTRWGLSDCVST